MNITLPNGVTLSGSPEKVLESARKLGYDSALEREYYLSASKGFLRIEEMASVHIRNAIIKRYTEWLDALHAERDLLAFCRTLGKGPTETDLNMKAMFETLYRRALAESRK